MRTRPKHRPALVLAALTAAVLAVCLAAGASLASDTVTATPSITLRETYDSNVNFGGKGDLEHSAAPALRVDLKQERLRGYVQARGTAFKYTSLNEYDRVDQFYDANLEANATERIIMNIKTGAILDHAFTSSLDDTGERTRRASRQVLNVQPSLTFNLGETSSLTMSYAFSKTDYDTQDYTDSMSNFVSGLWGYRATERTQLLLQLSGGRVEATTGEQDILSAMTGFEYALAETLKARLLGGMSTMHSSPKNAEKRTASNYSADTSLEWRLERLTTNAGYSRDMTMGVSGEDLVRDKLSLSLGFAAAERLQLVLGSNLVLSESSSTDQTKKSNRWFELTPGVRYRVGENSNLNLGYSYGSTKDVEKDELRTRNRISLDFNIAFP